ncbi:hypothetical protein [Sphingomonas mali]|uniref:hypothetical protein n=1 Tax=Sphingomonas mali TaxID=40682 RepID=UPI00083551EB|nr:hypothetical protein [Sphingomonas mali]
MRFIHPITAITLLGGIGLLAGCTPIDTTLGDSVKTDYALQTINPDPKPVPAEAAVMEGGSGTQAAGAAERYRKGAVKQPQAQTTGSGGSSGSGGGGGGGGGSPPSSN